MSSKGTNVSRDITVSVVSHRQNALVNALLEDLGRACPGRIALVVTENVPDPVALASPDAEIPFEKFQNWNVKGFGANHNAAFQGCRTPWFCVVNPDVRLPADPFPPLLECLKEAAVAGPLVRGAQGNIEDSARHFPTVGSLMKKLVFEKRKPDYPVDQGPVEVDWVAGMFMLFRAEAFRRVGGFDERYFLYYEDVDLCRRLRGMGESVVFQPRAEVVHQAQRASRRQLGRAAHHLRSALRFLAGV